MKRHLLSIADLSRDDIERILGRAESFAEVSGREIKKVPTLRGPHGRSTSSTRPRTRTQLELRAGRQAALSADLVSIKSSGLRGRQGRVAQGHGPDALRLRPGRDRDPLAARRRRRARRALDARPRWSTPATASTSTRPRRCSTSTRSSAGPARSRGCSIWIVGDVLHSRVARSNILAFTRMGCEVTVCGPPTLIPRGIESLGCEVRYDARRASARPTSSTRCGCSTSAWTARSCPRCASTPRSYQIDGRRLRPQPAADAPRPGQPRRRAGGRGDRLAAGADRRAGASPGWWCGWRSSTSCSPARGDAASGRARRADDGAAAGMSAPARARTGAPVPRAPTVLIRGARAARPARGPRRPGRPAGPRRRDRRGRATALERADGRRGGRRRGPARLPGFVDPHVHLRTPGREDEEDLDSGTRAAAAGGFCAILAMPNTDPVVDSRVGAALAARARPRRGARPGRLPRRDHARPARASSSPRWPSSPSAGAAGFTDDGLPVAVAPA